MKLSHVVLNSATLEEQTGFFMDLLGFRLSDTTDMMEFVRCSADHHSIAVARGEGPSLNHMAYEMANMDGLMRGAGRLKTSGFNSEWGVGRHGPGDNVFTYFVEPNGFVVEYTTEVQQVDESTYMANDAKYWREFPMRPCRWGMAGHPSNRLKAAFGGDTSVAYPEDGKRCEEIMAKTLGR
jgi:catechol 2,3-dioxygenase